MGADCGLCECRAFRSLNAGRSNVTRVGFWRHFLGLVDGSTRPSERALREATPPVRPPTSLWDKGPDTPEGYGPAIWTARVGGAAWECWDTGRERSLTWTETGWR